MKTILIVEDDKLNMKLFSVLLESQGFKVLQSPDGSDAIDLVKQHRPDLIIMDIQLPKVSGTHYIKLLKQDDELKHIPILVATAYAMKGDKQHILNSGCDAYISKPIDTANFLDVVNQWIN